MENKQIRVLVTGGGTKTRIDDVRNIGNFAKGGFPSLIGRAFVNEGAAVRIVGSERMIERMRFTGSDKGYDKLVPYLWFEDLERELFDQIETWKPDIVLMAAAVGDWICKDVTEGKIRSNTETLRIDLVRAPKLLSRLREACGKTTFIVGFKLLSGSTSEELFDAAYAQGVKNRLNLTVANDKRQFVDGQHPITLVTPEGGAIHKPGTRDENAIALVDFILKRFHVQWAQSVRRGPATSIAPDPAMGQISDLFRLTRDTKLFRGREGNVSWRDPRSSFWVSPRGVDKRLLEEQAMVRVRVLTDEHCVEYYGDKKSSIDTMVQAHLYERIPNLHGLFHFHFGFVLQAEETEFAYPCGTLEEANEILRALRRQNPLTPLDKTDGSFAVKLIHHGYVIGMPHGGASQLLKDWIRVKESYIAHLGDVQVLDKLEEVHLHPVFVASRIIGVVAEHKSEHWVSCFLLSEYRGKGYGKDLVEEVNRRGLYVNAHDDCGVGDYYVSLGWKSVSRDDALTLYEPPSFQVRSLAAEKEVA